MADKRFDNLINAALTEDRAKVDKALADANFSFFELLSLPGKFDALPPDTKAELARAYQDNPNIIPDAAKPAVEKALQGVEPAPAPPTTVASLPPAAAPATTSTPAAAPIPPESVPVTQSTLDFIMAREGFSPTAYKDGDHYSIGYGTYATPEEVRNGTAISQEAAQARLAHEAAQAANYVDSLGGKLNDNQRTALISMAYNVGTFGPGLTAAIQSGDPDAIAAMMGKYRSAQDPAASAGVSNRRDAEIALAKTPVGTTAVAYAPTGKAPSPAVAAVNALATGGPVPPIPPLPRERPALPTPVSGPVAPSTKPPIPTVRPADLTPLANDIQDGRRYTKGSTGNDVKELQHFLNQTGATDDKGQPLKEDGVYGNRTREAVKDFQRTHPGLVVDGVVGPRTLAAMEQDQTKMQQAAAERASANDPERDVPKLLTPRGVTDPVSEQLTQAARAGAAAEAYAKANPATLFSQPAIVATNLGTNLGGFISSPEDYLRTLPEANPAGAFSKPPVVQMGGFSFYPGETTGTGAARQAYTELTLPHDQPIDIYRGMMGYGQPGAAGNADAGEIVYNATSAAARRMMMESLSPEERAQIMGQDPVTGEPGPAIPFVPQPGGDVSVPTDAPQAAGGGTPIGGGDPEDPTTWPVIDGIPIPPEGTTAPPANDNLILPVEATPITPTLSTDDANTLFQPEPYQPEGSGSLTDNLDDPLGGAAG